MNVLNIINKLNNSEHSIKRKRKKLKNRIISVVVSTAILTNSIPFAGVFDYFHMPSLYSSSEMLNASADYTPPSNLGESAFNINPTIETAEQLSAYCYHYQNSSTFASDHANDTITLRSSIAFDENYLGIGTVDNPFNGTIEYPSQELIKSTYRAVFCYAKDTVRFTDNNGNPCKLVLTRSADVGTEESKPLLADHIVSNNGTGTWNIELTEGSSTFSGVFGEIGAGAHVDLTFTNNAETDVIFNGTDIADAGTICGKMGENSELILTYAGSFTSVTSEHGSAGGLVGEMEAGAALRLASVPSPYAPTVNAKDGYAGGIVGYMAESAVITNNDATPAAVDITVGAVNVKGKVAAGGLYGHYVFSSDQTIDLKNTTIDVANAHVSGGYCGTLYGVLETNSNLDITSNNTAVSCSSMSSGNGCFGGVIGKLVTSSLSQTISIKDLKISPTGNTAFSGFGGVIGCVDSAENTATYVNVNNVEVNATVTSGTTSFGGVIGDTSVSNGVFVDLGNFKLTTTGGVKGGSVVGTFNNGVLRLSGTTDLSGATITSAENCGQLVGYNNNVLVYALGNGSAAASPTAFSNSANNWRYLRPNGTTVDDLGTWGEVVRIVNGSNNIEQAGIITVNSNHSVTLAAPVISNISNTTDFAKTALNMMLNRGNRYGGLFTFAGSSPLSSNLTIKSDITEIDLSGTGLIGFMRDGSDNMGTFTGSLNGNSKVIKLAVGEAYGLKSNGNPVASTDEGVGQIYRHKNIGLFSSIGNGTTAGTVSNLKVAGTIDIHNKSADMNIGGISAKNGGNVTLTGVTVGDSTDTLTINYNEASSLDGTATTGVNIGGLVGLVDTAGTINVTGGASSVGAKLKMTGAKGNGTSYGGAVGKVTASSFTINIGDTTYALTIGMDADVSGLSSVGENSNCGGLIGNITDAGSYGARTVNINKLDFNDCKIGNAATANGGGMLGYSWLNTTANISGMTITSATINNSAANVGAMCYEATGKWVVDSLTVTSLSMPSGGGTSFGMLVNKAYTEGTANTDGTTNYTGGLYLDVLASGYDPTGATIPSTAKYDEIAAYSAKAPADILTGGAGVISINMNSARTGTDATVTTNGTYTNQLTGKSGVVNDTSRYYYNLDVMSSSDQAQNLLLWSVNRYAHSDISGEFVSSLSTMLSGTADMTGLSFYPVAKADGLTISTLDLTLNYAGINAKTGTTMSPSAATQHYLMHSGLFIDLSTGSTLTISGALTLRGNFLETGDYKGVLISNTMRGSLICTNGSIELAGITPSDNDGYLLINNIKRQNEQAIVPALNLYNVKTTGYTGTNITRSLIGPAEGPGLQMEFKWIKLGIIFSQASLLDSIKTDDKSLLKYTFTYDDDWGKVNDVRKQNVTYGREISESVQYSGQEKKYLAVSGQYDYYVNPTNDPGDPEHPENNAAGSFAGYKPYVREPYVGTNENDLYYCELKVNVQSDGLTVGCGTYNDPYELTSPDQLKSVAMFLKTSDSADLGKVKLPKTKAHLTSGDRWCDGKTDHADYTFNTTNNINKFTSSESGVTAQWTIAEVQQYLAAAYYKVGKDIVLASDFPGLGGTTANTAFRGVIVGDTNNDGTPKYSITNPSQNPFINVSNGSVIKDITINVRQNITREQDNVYDETASKYFTFGYGETDTGSRQAVFYGGIIGEIMGGDNIIDNSYVDFTSSSVTLSGENGTTIPVGGYVGVIVYGGLVFKNMTAEDTVNGNQVLRANNSGLNVNYTGYSYNLADNSNDEAWAAIYVNPLVGRVINGYAVNETEDVYETAEQAALNGHAKPQIVTSGKFTISEDGTYHDDDHTVRLNLPENAAAEATLRAKVKAFQDHEEGAEEPSAEEMEQYNNLSKLHTLKNGTKHYTIADINKSETSKLAVSPTTGTGDAQNGTISAPNAQALFVLSLITQSTAGTAQTIHNPSSNGIHTDETVETSRETDESGNVTIYQTRTIKDIDSSIANYVSSLSYGTDSSSNVYGMSHNADYSDVGQLDADDEKEDSDDFTDLASYDTAANSAVPYIIKHYTVGGEVSATTSETETETETEILTSEPTLFSAVDHDLDDLNGKDFYISGKGRESQGLQNTDYYLDVSNIIYYNNYTGPQASTSYSNLTKLRFTKSGNYYTIGYSDGETNYYLGFFKGNRNLTVSTTPYSFIISKSNEKWQIKANTNFNNNCINVRNETNFVGQSGAVVLYEVTEAGTRTTTTITRTDTIISAVSYPARCVTSTLGYYNIDLNANVEYALPDSFRGLGCVGIYDTVITNAAKYGIKLNTFDGKDCTIDEDIYINKFATDNYFNVLHAGSSQSLSSDTEEYKGNGSGGINENHGVGLFNNVITKNSSSSISNFTLSGSVNTEIYSNDYATSDQELSLITTGHQNKSMWLSVGGVCGWSGNGVWQKFSKIELNDLTVNGADFVGGLLGFSGTSSTDVLVTIRECSASNISVKMSSANVITQENSDATNHAQARNGMGCFVGRVLEGGVQIYGVANTSETVLNEDLTKFSTVKIKDFGFSDDIEYYTTAGGLVGFAGNGCKVYDMKVMPAEGQTVTIGSNLTRYAGGLVGLMQPKAAGGSTCVAVFYNCTVQEINVNGHYAGGFYGGKWINNYSPYSITIDTCKMVGNASSNNTITGNAMASDGYAGGFLGCGNVYTNGNPNILIKDSKVSNYTITSASSGGSVGGFMGYSGSQAGNTTITCYIHDSAVEHCVIGASGNYAGGAIGKVKPINTSTAENVASNKMLGYNIKLDNVTTGSGDNMGAWIGYLGNGKTSIQFTGVAIYGTGYSKNVGTTQSANAKLSDVSFVFADYTGQSYGNTTTPRMSVSGDDVFTLDASNKTILRTVSQDVTVNGKTENRMQVNKYSYSEEPAGNDTELADDWSLSNSQITRIIGGKEYVYDVTLTDNEIYSLNSSDKIITRQIISGSSTHTIRYNYTEVPSGTATTDVDQWSIDELNGKITRISGNMEYIYTIAVSGLNKGTTVEMPKYPFVNINPQSKLGDDEVLSSDGAVLYSGTTDSDYTSYNSYNDEEGETQKYPSADTMVAKIYYDLSHNTDNNSRRYTTCDDSTEIFNGKTIIDYLQPESDIGDRISTFSQESPVAVQSNVDDFAVIVIATGEEDETTNLINKYIQLVTNTNTDYAAGSTEGYFDVNIQTCKYLDGSFSIVNTSNHGLTNIGGKFQLDNNHVDSKEGTFTLLDVQFKDPFDTNKIAYHLYVPVYTVREMSIDFYAVAKTGAYAASNQANGNSYAALMDQTWTNNEFKHVDSLDTWMTHYIRYRYDPEDITALLNQGKVRWNYNKTIDFETVTGGAFKRLPSEHGNDTYMVLVDPNGNKDNVYYAYISDMRPDTIEENGTSYPCWELDFSRFKASDGTTPFSFPSFNTIINGDIEAVINDSNNGHYNKLDPTDSDDVAKINAGQYEVSIVTDSGNEYYVFTNDNDGKYDIQLKDGVTEIYEDYYISIKVPRPQPYEAGVDDDGTPYEAYEGYTDELYYYRVKSQNRLLPDNVINETGYSSNVKPAGLTQAFGCKIMIAEAYDQTLGDFVVLPENKQITATNRKITIDISTNISLNNRNATDCINPSEFFQSFYITLDRKIGNTIENDIPASAISRIDAYYSVDTPLSFDEGTGIPTNGYSCTDVTIGSNYIDVQTFPGDDVDIEDLADGQKKSSELFNQLDQVNGNATIYAHIIITFTEEHLSDEFPESTDEEGDGVNVKAASNLGYDSETLPRSSMTKKYPADLKYYYIMNAKNATLRYVSKANDIDAHDEIGFNSENRSTLGVNGLSVDDPNRTNPLEGTGYMPVNTQAYYYTHELPNLSQAKGMKLTFTLKKKEDDRTYSDIDQIQNYLNGDITFTFGEVSKPVEATGGAITVNFEVSAADFKREYADVVITFNAKSGDNFYEYANYEAYLTVELYTDKNCTDNNNIPNSAANDYLIYTNAKINPEFLLQSTNN